MRVLIQWSTDSPADWTEHDLVGLQDARNLPRKGEPDGTEGLDGAPGWVAAVHCQGHTLTGDHVGWQFPGAVGGLVILVWTTDPAAAPAVPFGEAWAFDPPAPDPALGIVPGYPTGIDPGSGQEFTYNTVLVQQRFADRAVLEANAAAGLGWAQDWLDDLNGVGQNLDEVVFPCPKPEPFREAGVSPWAAFPSLNKNEQNHRYPMSAAEAAAHATARTEHNWLEWVPGG